jgi:hypothetical protein
MEGTAPPAVMPTQESRELVAEELLKRRKLHRHKNSLNMGHLGVIPADMPKNGLDLNYEPAHISFRKSDSLSSKMSK